MSDQVLRDVRKTDKHMTTGRLNQVKYGCDVSTLSVTSFVYGVLSATVKISNYVFQQSFRDPWRQPTGIDAWPRKIST